MLAKKFWNTTRFLIRFDPVNVIRFDPVTTTRFFIRFDPTRFLIRFDPTRCLIRFDPVLPLLVRTGMWVDLLTLEVQHYYLEYVYISCSVLLNTIIFPFITKKMLRK